MNSLRRHIMMQQGGGGIDIPYTTPEDLLFYLDFYDYAGGDIKEYVQKINFVNTNVVAGVNCAEFANGSSFVASTQIDMDNVYSFEIVAELNSARGNIFTPYDTGKWSFSSKGSYAGLPNNYSYLYWNNQSNVYLLNNGKQVISARVSTLSSYVLRNYSQLERRTVNQSQWPILNTIGGNGFVGKIMCIRGYSRELTDAEFLANQQIDNQRFNLGL